MTTSSLLTRLLTPYVLCHNALDYPLRRLIRLPRPIDHVQPAGLDAALGELAPVDRAQALQLIADYNLATLAVRGRRRDVLENLYYLDLLAAALEEAEVTLPPDRVEAIDVGVSHWFYAPALCGLLAHWRADRPRAVHLLGFETDPGRRYADGHTREDWAAWHTAGLTGVRFVPEDVRGWWGEVDLATMLFPFVFSRDADRWGLPRSLFRPPELLGHVWARVRPGGALVVANQGEAERDEQLYLFESVGAPVVWSGHVASPFWRYDVERYVHVARRPLSPTDRPGAAPPSA